MNKELVELLQKKEEENKIVFAGIEGLQVIDIDRFIEQPLEGLLYDLNRSREVVLTLIEKDSNRVNDFSIL